MRSSMRSSQVASRTAPRADVPSVSTTADPSCTSLASSPPGTWNTVVAVKPRAARPPVRAPCRPSNQACASQGAAGSGSLGLRPTTTTPGEPSCRSINCPTVASAKHFGVHGTSRLALWTALTTLRSLGVAHCSGSSSTRSPRHPAGGAATSPSNLDHRGIEIHRWAPAAAASKIMASITRARCAHRLTIGRRDRGVLRSTTSSISTRSGHRAYARLP